MSKERAEGVDGAAGASAAETAERLRQSLDVLTLATPQRSAAKDMSEARQRQYAFWDTQPVPKFDENCEANEEIEGDRDASDIRQQPYSLPAGYVWSDMDMTDSKQVVELYTLLTENYVEDDDNMFRFDYSAPFLQWALQPPGWLRKWHCGVRSAGKTSRLLAFISAVPCTIRVFDKVKTMVEINFLCVHKKLRSKRVAPVLIREVTRRVNQEGIFQAVFTAGIIIPRPIATCRYWHRSLNPKKLIEVKFSHLQKNMTLQRTLKFYKLPEVPKTPGFRMITAADMAQTYRLLDDYLKHCDLAPVFSLEEFQHFFQPRENVIQSYVVEKAGRVTDFVSYYTLPSSVMHHATHKSIKAAYSFYTVAGATPLVDLMHDALVTARNDGFDVFNALDLMDNGSMLEKLKFGIGDGNLQYYLYNWKCASIDKSKIGLVLQ